MQNSFDQMLLRGVLAAVAVALLVALLVYFEGLLKPFAVALVVWYLIKALYDAIGRVHIAQRRFPRWLQRMLSFVVAVGAAALTLQLVTNNLSQMATNYDQYQASLEGFLMRMGGAMDMAGLTDQLYQQVGHLNLPKFLSNTVASLSNALSSTLLVMIYVIFLLLEESAFSRKFDILFDSKDGVRVHKMMGAIQKSIDKYLLIKTYVSLLTGFLTYVILALAGVEYAFLWAFLTFLFNYVPYVGSVVATILPALFSMLQLGSPWLSLWLFLGITAVHFIVGNYVEPRMMGKSLNLSPLVVVAALSFWGSLWGLLGMLLSVPITSIILIVLAQFQPTRKWAVLLTEDGDLEGV